MFSLLFRQHGPQHGAETSPAPCTQCAGLQRAAAREHILPHRRRQPHSSRETQHALSPRRSLLEGPPTASQTPPVPGIGRALTPRCPHRSRCQSQALSRQLEGMGTHAQGAEPGWVLAGFSAAHQLQSPSAVAPARAHPSTRGKADLITASTPEHWCEIPACTLCQAGQKNQSCLQT